MIFFPSRFTVSFSRLIFIDFSWLFHYYWSDFASGLIRSKTRISFWHTPEQHTTNNNPQLSLLINQYFVSAVNVKKFLRNSFVAVPYESREKIELKPKFRVSMDGKLNWTEPQKKWRQKNMKKNISSNPARVEWKPNVILKALKRPFHLDYRSYGNRNIFPYLLRYESWPQLLKSVKILQINFGNRKWRHWWSISRETKWAERKNSISLFSDNFKIFTHKSAKSWISTLLIISFWTIQSHKSLATLILNDFRGFFHQNETPYSIETVLINFAAKRLFRITKIFRIFFVDLKTV